MNSENKGNPLGYAPMVPLIFTFAIPSIIAMLVSAVYNIADQLFIGRTIGTLGNAATNIAFPLSMFCTAAGLMFGVGGASNFNLKLGAGDKEKAVYYVGNAFTCLAVSGFLLFILTECCLKQMMVLFGAPSDVLPYAMTYVRITAIGFPFLILTIGGGHLIRADGSPVMTMICSLSGAVINIGLDALFMLVLHWGMEGAALATIIGQIFSAFLVLNYIRHYKSVPLEKKHFRLHREYVTGDMSMGIAACINQLAMMATQIALNNSLKYYGSLSVYGEAIPIACAGIVTKVNQVFFSIVIGLSQSSQPIESFNYGARKYDRVLKAYALALGMAFCISMCSFILFQTVPKQIMALFGKGSEEYFTFGAGYFRIYLFFTWANCMQPITSNLFTSIGKPIKGTLLSLTRQILFLLPLILILPLFMGIDGILYAGPVADGAAFLVAILMAASEIKNIKKLEAALCQ